MKEDLNCYGSPRQRELIKAVAAAPLFNGFFLTGGTCLSVFYLHHRVSHDLGFFTTNDVMLTEMAPAVHGLLRPDRVLATSKHFLSCVVDGIKVDFVVDPLSGKHIRPTVVIDEVLVTVDVLDNVGPNKLCALFSRTAPKDMVDCYMLYRQSEALFLRDYRVAREREALLDDMLYAGEKLIWLSENATSMLREIARDLRVSLSEHDLRAFYARVGQLLFRHAASGEGALQ